MKIESITIAVSLGLLTSCGGSSGGNSTTLGEQEQQATFSLAISDAPVDEASEVVLYFNEVVLVPQDNSEAILVSVSDDNDQPRRVDLLDFQGGDSNEILSGIEVEPGAYKLCLYALDGDGSQELSYVNSTDQGIVPLRVNSKGSCQGVSGNTDDTGRIFFNQAFTLNAGQNNFVAEFDLRKGLVDPKGKPEFFIKPTAVQLINRVDTGVITGTVEQILMQNCEADAVAQTVDGSFSHVVYLYEGTVEQAIMADVDNSDNALAQPVATTNIRVDEATQAGSYKIAFVAEGDYSLGYSCLGQNDSTEEDNLGSEAGEFAIYQTQGAVTVNAETTVVQNFVVSDE
jgi:hypothetical protein